METHPRTTELGETTEAAIQELEQGERIPMPHRSYVMEKNAEDRASWKAAVTSGIKCPAKDQETLPKKA